MTTNQKPRIILFEGTDGFGKDYHIDQLMKRYPEKFITMRLPTDPTRQFLKSIQINMNHQNIDHIKLYNNVFLADFLSRQKEIKAHLEHSDKTILLNRYFFSSLSYARLDINKYYNRGGATSKVFVQWNEYVEQHYYPFLDTIIQPDICIFLNGRFAKKTDDKRYEPDELLIIQETYENEIQAYNNRRISMNKTPIHLSMIQSHLPDNNTFHYIQSVLYNNDIIGDPTQPDIVTDACAKEDKDKL